MVRCFCTIISKQGKTILFSLKLKRDCFFNEEEAREWEYVQSLELTASGNNCSTCSKMQNETSL